MAKSVAEVKSDLESLPIEDQERLALGVLERRSRREQNAGSRTQVSSMSDLVASLRSIRLSTKDVADERSRQILAKHTKHS